MSIYMRLAQSDDLPTIMAIIDEAKKLLKADGSPQWQNGQPSQALLAEDIVRHQAYCLVVDEKIAGVAVLQTTPDPNYAQIAGRWHNTRDQYASIHRFAVRGDLRGQHLGQNFMFKLLARGMLQGISNFRIDTHVANQRMQGLISGAAFRYRGVVQVDQTKDGERLAYELNL